MSDKPNAYGKNSKRPILVFGLNKRLLCAFPSIGMAAKVLRIKKAGIFNALIKDAITYQNLYFRYLHSNIEITTDDLGALNVVEYDKLCEDPHKIYKSKNKLQIITSI